MEEISLQIRQLRALVEQRLAEATIKERTGEVLGIQEALNEFLRLRSHGILDNVVTESATTKRKILGYLTESETPLGYYHAYNTLLCTLIPLRIRFSIKVDGKSVYNETFYGVRQRPQRNIADMRREARQKRDELAERYADLVSEDIRRCYDTAQALSQAICG